MPALRFPPLPDPSPDIFSVSRRFDMATILVAMGGYALLFGGLHLLGATPETIAAAGVLFAVVAIAQAISIRWGNPRAASIIAGVFFWNVAAAVILIRDGNYDSWSILGGIFAVIALGPITGYLVGVLVGGVFLIAHYLRQSKALRRRIPASEDEPNSPWES